MVAGRPTRTEVDVEALARTLRARVAGEVRFDDGTRALYATDASNYRHIPIGLVYPRDADDVLETIEVCRKDGVPVLSRGTGTGLAGQTCNVAVILDFTRHMNRVVELDPERRIARVQPGCVLDHLRAEAEKHHLTFAPDPATHAWCSLGGMIGNNSCGVHSVMGGRTSDNTVSLDVVTYRGLRASLGAIDDATYDRLVATNDPVAPLLGRLRQLRDGYEDEIRARFPAIPRRVSGYNLVDLLPENGFHVGRMLVGSEGTLVTVLEATVRLVESPPCRALVALGYPDVFRAADHLEEVLATGPIGLEGIDDKLLADTRANHLAAEGLKLLPEGGGFLLAEYGADTMEEAQAKAEELRRRLDGRASVRVYTPDEAKHIWELRESGLGATARVPGLPDTWPGWEDAAVPVSAMGPYLREFEALLDRYGYRASLYGHFGQGCVHCSIPFDLTSASGIAKYRAFVTEAADLVASHGGSISGEHGDGQSRGELLPRMFGERLIQAFREVKGLFDPDGRMNPGRVVDARPLDADLRLGADWHPREPVTHFQYAGDDGSMMRATLRCVGVGKCRREAGGTMCPSWRVTHDERHTTRGRAHLLHEMLRGDSPIRDAWRSDAVKEALDLCLSCKGCKHDCPMGVDVATYKAEFLAHHYEGRTRPRTAVTLGRMHHWARLASLAPNVVNVAMRLPGLGTAAKWVAGIHPARPAPAFATTTFRAWARRHRPANADGREVIVWADTWTEHFHPEIGRAAVRVLEAAGWRPRVLQRWACCGRPLYDYGLLDEAKARLRECIAATAPSGDAPIVVLEPSCASVFRDEMPNLMGDDPAAKRLAARVVTLGELLDREAPLLPAHFDRRVILHGHCHQKAVLDADADARVLRRLGADVEVLDDGCCGMAGSFGFEREKYDVSVAVAEHAFLPALRKEPGAVVVTDGFSCRTQADQLAGRRTLHLAEVVEQAVAAQSSAIETTRTRRGWVRGLLAALAGATTALLTWVGLGRRRPE